ncbi:MAG TPA: hypothetical protein VKR61_17085 [Bryobacteraceae bacterium]|nr:hypothetical protein [Bryobacteraceae bacterium]
MDRRRPLAYASLAAALLFGWQWLTVRVNYGGNWTALYCTGAVLGVPDTLSAEHVYQFPHSYGYDGQMYHYVAHDPLIRTEDLKAHVDNPSLRYRRILVPGLAYLLACGRADWVDPAYYALILLFTAGGVYWTAACCRANGRAAAWGIVFLLLPATLASMDRMVVDVVLAALVAAFVWHVRTPSWRLFVVLAAAALVRETGFLLPAAYCGYLLLRHRFAQAAAYALAVVPALAWYAYIRLHTSPASFTLNPIPLSAIWTNWLHPLVYPPAVRLKWLAPIGDRLALIGMMMAFALALYRSVTRRFDPVALATLSFVAMGVLLQRNEIWAHVYDYGRVYSPVLVFLGLASFERRPWIALVPLALMLPRIGMQLGGQILGVVHWL